MSISCTNGPSADMRFQVFKLTNDYVPTDDTRPSHSFAIGGAVVEWFRTGSGQDLLISHI